MRPRTEGCSVACYAPLHLPACTPPQHSALRTFKIYGTRSPSACRVAPGMFESARRLSNAARLPLILLPDVAFSPTTKQRTAHPEDAMVGPARFATSERTRQAIHTDRFHARYQSCRRCRQPSSGHDVQGGDDPPHQMNVSQLATESSGARCVAHVEQSR